MAFELALLVERAPLQPDESFRRRKSRIGLRASSDCNHLAPLKEIAMSTNTKSLTDNELLQLVKQAAEGATSFDAMWSLLYQSLHDQLGARTWVMWLGVRGNKDPALFGCTGSRLPNITVSNTDAGTLPGFGQDHGITCMVAWR